MIPPCAKCAKSLRVPVNFNSEEIVSLEYNLRFESGPSVITQERAKELRTILALVDEDIEGYNSEVAFLERQRTKLLSLLSPIPKLPNEILLHIFQDVCEKNLFQCYPRWLDEDGPPTELTSPVITYLPTMAISSVCSRWRKLALSTPSLWANLTVETHGTSDLDEDEIPDTFAGFIGTVTRYLERSRDWPLSLELTIYGSLNSNKEVPCLDLLTRHTSRWKMLKYSGCRYLTHYHVPSHLNFSLLADLNILESSGLVHFEHFPGLCALSTLAPIRPTSGVLYNQLNHLTLHGRVWEDLMETLRGCPSLKSLTLVYPSPDVEGTHGTWHNITSFSLVIVDGSDTIFSYFNFPSLKNLVVKGGLNGKPTSKAFTSFISRSSCMITTFTLRDLSLPDQDLIAVLQLMPALLHLEVHESLPYSMYHSPITSHFISCLTHRESTSISLVPNLHTFYLESRAVGSFDDAAFVSMVESRWFKPGSALAVEMLAKGRSSIRSVVLKATRREVDADIYKPLRILDTEGLRVVVSGTNGVQV